MTTELIIKSIQYVVGGSMFWGAMGFTTAVGMFIGAMIYDGELNQAKKGLLSVISYAIMLGWVNLARISESISLPDFNLQQHPEYAPAGVVTLVIVTLAWTLGVLLGVAIFRHKYKGGHA